MEEDEINCKMTCNYCGSKGHSEEKWIRFIERLKRG